METMMTKPILTLAMFLAACSGAGNKSEQAPPAAGADSRPAPPAADNAGMKAAGSDFSGYLLGVMQRPGETEASDGRNEWILVIDPDSGKLSFSDFVEGRKDHVQEAYAAPVAAPDGSAVIRSGRISVALTKEECESDHGGLGSGSVRGGVTIAGVTPAEPISMCFVAARPSPDVRRPNWDSTAF